MTYDEEVMRLQYAKSSTRHPKYSFFLLSLAGHSLSSGIHTDMPTVPVKRRRTHVHCTPICP